MPLSRWAIFAAKQHWPGDAPKIVGMFGNGCYSTALAKFFAITPNAVTL